MTSSTLTISIGRSVPASRVGSTGFGIVVEEYVGQDKFELSSGSWLNFQMAVDEFRGNLADTRSVGTSSWNGVSEDTAVFQWFNSPRLTERELALLACIRDEFGQEAIAVSYSTPKFI